ncbi:MAG: hypothetical protein RBT60_00060 [Candidatus Krumholzibacteria bacterium]|nr:hypothetical protein [Candidatus Krumholzibacteria bacterium]
MNLPRPQLLLPILEQHFVELDILWERREACLGDPVMTARDLADIEQRAHRHLEGLLLGQAHALDLARPALQGEERGAATAAAFVMLDLGPTELRAELIAALAAAAPEAAHGIRIALRHRDVADLEPGLRELAATASPLVRACACDVLAFHRHAPVASVRELLDAEDEEIRALAVGCLGRWGGPWSADDLRAQLAIPSAVRSHRAALETSARLALPGLLEICREAAYRETEPSLEALRFLGVIGDAGEIPGLQQVVAEAATADQPDSPALARGVAALAALGGLGSPHGVPILLAAFERPLLMHAAAAAFLRITGAEDVKGEPVPPPAELDAEAAEFWDEHVEVDPELARRWWQEHGGRFVPTARWQAGVAVAGWPVDEKVPLAGRRDVWLADRYRKKTAGAAEAVA